MSLFDEHRAAQAAAYLLFRAGGRLPVIKLMKLLYLAERTSLLRYGEPLTGDRMFSLPHGPVLSLTLELINGARASAPGGWESWIADRANHAVELADPSTLRSADDLDRLSESDVEVLHDTWEGFGHMGRWELVRHTHDTLPEWQDLEGSNQPISPADVFLAGGFGKSGAKKLARRLETQEALAIALSR